MQDLPPPIRTFLADFVARRRRLALAKAVALAIATGLAVLLMACLADRFLRLPRAVRGGLLLADLAAIVLILRRPLREAMRGHAAWIEAAKQVESIEPAFAQRLITVTSQLQSREAHRGSAGMLAALVSEVSASALQRRGASLLGWRWIKRSLTLAGCFAAVTLAAAMIPWLQFPQLVARFTRPWANIPPVSSTHFTLLPGEIDVPQGRAFRMNVTASHVGEGPVQLHVKQPDGWAVSDLEPVDGEHFACDLPPLEHDSAYFLTGGDARSDTFAVHVLTSPGLSELRARIHFPAYLRWADKPLTLLDGKLDVPTGSEVTVSLVATEPLAGAMLTSPVFATLPEDGRVPGGGPARNGQKNPGVLPTAPSVDPAVRTAKFTVTRDLTAAVTLRSSQGVEQTIAQPLSIKAIPDRPPTVRLLVPGEDLQLGPTDLLTTAGQAMDDYGIEQLFLQIRVNDRPPTYQPITITGDRRRIEMPIECDLAMLGVQVGDLLQITLLAKDGAGQQRGSDVLRVIVSPRALNLNDYLRMAELKAAKRLVDDLLAQLTTARNELNQSADAIAKDGDKSLQNLAGSAQTAQLLAMPLLRAAARADQPELANSIAAWADAAEQTRAGAEELQDERSRKLDPGQIAGPLDQAVDRTRRTTEQLAKAIRLSEALAVRNAAASANDVTARAQKLTGADHDRLLATATRLRAAAQAAGQSAGFNLAEFNGVMPDVENAIADAQNVLRSNPPIDFGSIANEWSALLQHAGAGNLLATRSGLELIAMDPRWATASSVEMVRPDADFVRASDTSLAARAGEALATVAVSLDVPANVKDAVADYPNAARDLLAEHQMHRAKPAPANSAEIVTKAQAAREKMRRWAGDQDSTLASGAASEQQLALDAAAAQQQRKFQQASALDRARLAAAKSAQQKLKQKDVASQADAAQRLDLLRQRQQQLAEQTAAAAQQAASGDRAAAEKAMDALARQQQALAKTIEDAREQQQPADRLAADEDQVKAEDPVAAIAEARKALADLRQADAEVRQAPDDATKADRAGQVDSSAVEAANARLAKVSPAADEAHAQIDEKVVGGVRQLKQAARGHDSPAVAQSADQVDAAVRDAMKKLDAAEEKLADRDAMAAAQAAAQQASDQMKQAAQDPADAQKQAGDEKKAEQQAAEVANAEKHASDDAKAGKPAAGPPLPGQAHRPANGSPAQTAESQAEAMAAAQQAQARTLSALERAVDRAAASGGQARVRETPAIDAIFSLLPILIDGTGPSIGGEKTKAELPSVREWGRLRPRDEQGQTAVSSPVDPAGYEASLRAYFETLAKRAD